MTTVRDGFAAGAQWQIGCPGIDSGGIPMDTTEVKRLLRTWLAKLREQDDGLKVTRRIALLAISAVLAYLGVDTADLFDEQS
jgi:hypothetical protein